MRRWLSHTSYFTPLVLILTLVLSFVYVSIAASQNSAEVVSKLKSLREDVKLLPDESFEKTHSVKGQRNALINKINAAIHQIEAGAFNGAINKLENDLKNTIEAWIIDEYAASLLEKVEEIIELIKGELHHPDFSMEASPASLTIALGESDSSIITITSLNGFSKLVELEVADVPSDVTATFDPTQVTPPADGMETSTLTVSVDMSATPGTYVLVITGTSDLLQYSLDISLQITELPPSPDFLVEANPTFMTMEQGSSDTSIITVTSLNGFDQPVDLTVTSTSIPGVTISLYPDQVAPPADGSANSTLTVQVADSVPPEAYMLTVAGTSGSLLHSADIELEVTIAPPSPDFSIVVIPSFLSIQQGTSGTTDIIITSLNSFNDLVTLTVSQAIEGVMYRLDPSAVTPPANGVINSTLTVAVAETVTPNSYVLVLTGTSGVLQHSASLSLEITTAPPPPDLEPPTVRIDEPVNGAYLAGVVDIVVFVYDKNFKRAELSIDSTLIAVWTSENVSTGEHSILWDTTLPGYQDDSYVVFLSAEDEAGNTNEKAHSVTVDNTEPTASINAPADESHLRSSVLIRVTGEDINFYKMNLEIDDVSVKTWTTDGSKIYEWNTEVDGIDAVHTITATVYDKAGNSDECSIMVTVDNTLPTIRIDEPTEGSYLADAVDIEVFIQEDNLDKVELVIDDAAVDSWTIKGEHVFKWDTTTYVEGIHFIKLNAMDKAGNIGEKTIKVIVDNTAPKALINAPMEGSYLKDAVSIDIAGDDANFDRMELRIGDVLVETWNTSGNKLYLWNTTVYSDGAYEVTLTVYDKANNSKGVTIAVSVDNTPPIIEVVTWTPKDPSTGEHVNVTVKIIDPQPSSGLQNVTLWYINTTMDYWQPLPMSLNVTSGNWTATIPGQSIETIIRFDVETFDNAGNKALSEEIYEYKVVAPSGIPLAWIIVIIFLILAATVAAIYFWRKRRREKKSISGSREKNYKLTVLLCF